ncbi:MAG: BamA/TamA family outer membrane protein, partial [Deltaproteobacteria bacterium]|nr:BamA/TamA family outer membrane protein [Deltaproteobacteria bacterium]
MNQDLGEIDSIISPPIKISKKKDFVFFSQDAIPYYKSAFLKAKEVIEELYLDHGYLEVQIFGPKEINFIQEHWVHLQFRIEEGEQTRVNKINILGGDTHIKDPAIQVGEPLNLLKVEDLRIQLEESFWNIGYAHAEVSSTTQGSEVNYQVNLGKRVKIESIEITGNKRTLTAIIRNRLKIQPDEWYSLLKLSESRSAILQTDLFSEVNMELSGSTLLIEVKERERNTLELGLGASLVEGPRVTAVWQYRNIFGRGISFRTRARVNYPAVFYDIPILYAPEVSQALKDQTSNYFAGRLSAGFLYPKLLGIPFDLDANIDFSAERVLQQAYVLNDLSTTSSLTAQFFYSHLRLTPQIELEYANFNCPTCTADNQNLPVASSRFDKGTVRQITLRLLSILDFRDDALNPKKGISFELNTDFGFGTAEVAPISYSKVVGGFTSYVPLVRGLTWILNGRAGGIWTLAPDTYVPLFKRFYLGGTNTVRGFQENQIFPVDVVNPSIVSLGGYFMIFARNEIRFPIAGDWQGALFVDTGELMSDINSFKVDKLAMSTGFGIRYNTPIGPLMFDLGIRLFDADRIRRDNFFNLFGLHF